MSKRKQLLDPIGTMCKLIGLNFTETNTKISIHEHILTLHRPNSYQWMIRFYNGDGRENISELYYAVVRLVQWYLMPQFEEKIVRRRSSQNSRTSQTSHHSDSEAEHEESKDLVKFVEINAEENSEEIASSEELRRLVHYLCHSIRKLQETYANGNVVLALQFYIIILEAGLNGTYDNNLLPTYLNKDDTLASQRSNLLDYQKIRNLWDLDKLKKVCELYDKCFSTDINEESGPIIEGYLRSIDTILNGADQEFQLLIRNSNEG